MLDEKGPPDRTQFLSEISLSGFLSCCYVCQEVFYWETSKKTRIILFDSLVEKINDFGSFQAVETGVDSRISTHFLFLKCVCFFFNIVSLCSVNETKGTKIWLNGFVQG